MTTATTLAMTATVETIADAFTKLVAAHGNDIDATLQDLGVPSPEWVRAKTKIAGLLESDPQVIRELEIELSAGEQAEGARYAATKGGVTRYEVMKSWGVSYGERLYVSHDLVNKSLDIGAFVAAVAAVCPEGQSLAAGLAITIAALKLIDQGNGVIITRVPIRSGPCIPKPQ